jgi:hypothetical protein
LHQAPFTPAAFDAATGKGHVRVISQRGLDASISLFRRTGVKVDCNAIAYGRQLPGLLNDRVPILVTEKKTTCGSSVRTGRVDTMGFPGPWMTESESMVYRVVPKCA